jgi:HSP20 family protein
MQTEEGGNDMVFNRRQDKDSCQVRVIQPLVNIEEEDKDIVVEAEMPGLAKDDITLDLNGNELSLKGRAKKQEDEIPKGYTLLHKERCPLEYARTFVVGDNIDKAGISAQYDNGILKVRLAKAQDAQPKKIDIKG